MGLSTRRERERKKREHLEELGGGVVIIPPSPNFKTPCVSSSRTFSHQTLMSFGFARMTQSQKVGLLLEEEHHRGQNF